MTITIISKDNGYEVVIRNSLKWDSNKVYTSLEQIKLLEAVGLAITEHKVEVKE